MSVLLKDIDIPQNCYECLFAHITHKQIDFGVTFDQVFDQMDRCRFLDRAIYGYKRYRPRWCPLVEIPKKHGELIDKDKVTTKINNLIEKFEIASDKCYHPDFYFDTDKSFGRYRAYSYKADGVEAALNEIISVETIIESEE